MAVDPAAQTFQTDTNNDGILDSPPWSAVLDALQAAVLRIKYEELDEMIADLTVIQAVSLHSDISVKTGERIFCFTLAENLEAKLKG